jgi:hypothetical protein
MCVKEAEVVTLVKAHVAVTEKRVAVMTLGALRTCRDTAPDEWDALLKSEAGSVILALWDYLKSLDVGENDAL